MEQNLTQRIEQLEQRFEQNINDLKSEIPKNSDLSELKNELRLIEYQKEFLAISKDIGNVELKNRELETKIENLNKIIPRIFWIFSTVIGSVYVIGAIFAFIFNSGLNESIENKIDETIKITSKEELQKLRNTAENYIKEIQTIKDRLEKQEKIVKKLQNNEKLTKKEEKEKEEITEKIKHKKDKTADDYFFLALAEQNNENYQKAIELYKKATEINPKSANAYSNLGSIHYVLKNYLKAIELYKKAIEINPKSANYYNNLGASYNNLGKYKEATKNYKRAIEIKPNYHEAYYNMGINYNNLDEYQNAIEAFYKAIELKLDYYEAYNNMGDSYYALGKYQNAIEAFYKAIKLKPNNINSLLNVLILNLITDSNFDKEIEQRYIELTKNEKEKFIYYEMMKILKNIQNGARADELLAKWSEEYRDTDLNDWSFKPIDKWIEKMESNQIKEELQKAVEIFKNLNLAKRS